MHTLGEMEQMEQMEQITLAEAHAICDSLLPADAAYVLGVESWRHAHPADYSAPDNGQYKYNRKVEVRFYNCGDGVKFKAPTIAEVIEEVKAHYYAQRPGMSAPENQRLFRVFVSA